MRYKREKKNNIKIETQCANKPKTEKFIRNSWVSLFLGSAAAVFVFRHSVRAAACLTAVHSACEYVYLYNNS